MNDLVTFQGEDSVLLCVFQRCCVLSPDYQFNNGLQKKSTKYW
jgi:hypothetical protein